MKQKDKKHTHPPGPARRFLLWFLRDELAEEVLGDLEEQFYATLDKKSPAAARRNYWFQVFNYLRPFAIKNIRSPLSIHPAMYRHNFKIAFRTMARQKGFSGINILGLTISLSVVLLLFTWIQDEIGTDRYHSKGSRIYDLKKVIPQEGGSLTVNPNIPYPFLKAIQSEVPGVEQVGFVGYPMSMIFEKGEIKLKESGIYGNTGIFDIFDFPVLHGQIKQIDENLSGLAVSESLAKKLFGEQYSERIGAEIVFNGEPFTVEAIFEDIPANSTLQFDFFANIEHRIKHNPWIDDWGNSVMKGSLLLREGADPQAILAGILDIYKAGEAYSEGQEVLFQPYGDGYLYGIFDERAVPSKGRIEYVRIFSIAGLFLLIIACINFINLSTARASRRAKEVGVRKTVGANNIILTGQFMTESTLLTGLSVILAVILANTLLPTVRTLTDKPLAVDFFSPLFLGALLAMFVLTSIFAGSYPAFVLTSFKPVLALKGRISDSFRHLNLRKGLVITQFILAALLIIGAVIIREQINFINKTNIGLNRNNLIKIEADDFALEKFELLKAELLAAPGIATVSASSHSPVQVGASTTGVSWTGKREAQKHQEFYMMWVDADFRETMEIPMSAGRFYHPEMKLDTSNIVLNEKAVEVMGLDDPVGRQIQWWGMPVTIIGVVRDFNFSSLYNPVEPFAFILDQSNVAYIFVRPESGKTEQALTGIQNVFEKVTPASYLAYEFVDEQYGQMYKAEALMGKLADYFAFLSIFISCIGIIGLSTFFAEQKVKEIGIRKILGAGVGDLVVFLSRNFLWPVLFGMLIGLPLSWYLLNKWLSRFAYAIDIAWWMLAVPELLIAGIVVLIVGFQGVKAARVNPVESLRLE